MSKSSISVTMKVLKLDDKVKAINLCDVGKSCRVVAEEMVVGRTQIMNILKEIVRLSTILKKNVPISRKCQHHDTGNENNLTDYAWIGFRILFINIFIYLFVCFT